MQELNENVDLKKLGNATLIMRNEGVALYQRDKNIFEVFKRKYRQEKKVTFKGKEVIYPAGEIYPSNEDFGVWAWCYTSLEDAERKYNILVNN